MKLSAANDAAALAWLQRNYGVTALQTPRVVLSIVDDQGQIRGVFVITWRNDTSAELHVYGDLSNEVVKGMFRAVFGPLGLHRLEVRTPRRHKKIRKAAIKYGFQFEAVSRDYYGPGNDGFVYAMTADQCRWIKEVARGVDVQIA